jgi:hypothetical protein
VQFIPVTSGFEAVAIVPGLTTEAGPG